jgi:hypothetical protein
MSFDPTNFNLLADYPLFSLLLQNEEFVERVMTDLTNLNFIKLESMTALIEVLVLNNDNVNCMLYLNALNFTGGNYTCDEFKTFVLETIVSRFLELDDKTKLDILDSSAFFFEMHHLINLIFEHIHPF